MRKMLAKVAKRIVPVVVIALRIVFAETKSEIEGAASRLVRGLAHRVLNRVPA